MGDRTTPPNGPEGPAPDGEDELLDQDALDALLNSVSSEQEGEKAAAGADAGGAGESESADELLSQADLDALIAQNSGDSEKPEPEPEPAGQGVGAEPDAEEGPSLLDQAELDALIAAQRETGEQGSAMDRFKKAAPQAAEEPASVEASELLDQAEIEAMMSGQTADPGGEADAEEPDLLSQEELDSLVGQHVQKDASEAPAEEGSGEEDQPAPTEGAAAPDEGEFAEAAMDQAALDALVARSDALERSVSADGDDFLGNVLDQDEPLFSQEELDELLAMEPAGEPESEEPVDEPAEPATEEPGAAAPERAPEAAREELEQTLAAEDADEALTAPMDEALQTAGGNALTSQEDIDAILAGEDDAGAGEDWTPEEAEGALAGETAGADAPPGEEDDGLLSQELLDALLGEAKEEEEGAKQEQLAQAAAEPPPEVDVPSPEELEETAPANEAEPPPSKSRKRRFRKPVLPVLRFPKLGAPRIPLKTVVSLAAGLLAAFGVYYGLKAMQGGVPALGDGGGKAAMGLALAIEEARDATLRADYPEAVRLLSRGLAAADENDPLRREAEYLRLEAIEIATEGRPPHREKVVAAIDRVTGAWPGDRRATHMMHWKARMLEDSGQTRLAMNVYRETLDATPGAEGLAPLLLDAGRLALELGRPDEAQGYARRILDLAQQGPYASEARLLLSKAQAELGGTRAARAELEKVAQSPVGEAAGVQARIRLARLDLEEGKTAEAIEKLEEVIFSTTTTEGADEAYLLLARAHSRQGDYEKAESILRDLLQFFRGSPLTPEAYVLLTEVLDAQGKRREAAQIALQASQRHPESAAVMRNLARMRELQGNAIGAAHALMAAEEAGANDPGVVLEAARHFRAAGEPEEAMQAYDLLALRYPDAPQAFTGLCERAEAVFEAGQPRAAIKQLEDLAALSRDRPRRLMPLQALARVYDRMGLRRMANEQYVRVAGLTTDPDVMAEAAAVLLRNGAINEGLEAAGRVAVADLRPERAYDLMYEKGKALLQRTPRQGLALMAEAQERYPEQRAPDEVVELVEALLAADQPAQARAHVEDLTRRMRTEPELALAARDANLLWGDYLFERGSYEAAVSAYDAACRAGPRHDADGQWAHYQRASAQLEGGDLAAAIPLLDRVASSASDWAEYAAAKAEAGRSLQRLRGLPVTPGPEAIALSREGGGP